MAADNLNAASSTRFQTRQARWTAHNERNEALPNRTAPSAENEPQGTVECLFRQLRFPISTAAVRLTAMSTTFDTAVLDQVFEPVTQCFSADVAKQIAALHASPELQAQLDELAEKNTEGKLTKDELETYEALVRAVNFVGILQAKARAMLNQQGG